MIPKLYFSKQQKPPKNLYACIPSIESFGRQARIIYAFARSNEGDARSLLDIAED